MVVSIETTMKHPRRGFIKLEDTVAVTATGHEIFGEGGRGWNRGGPQSQRAEPKQNGRHSCYSDAPCPWPRRKTLAESWPRHSPEFATILAA
jgi:hypothetical protein